MTHQNEEASAAEKSAAEVAHALGLRWMREHWSEDLSGKEQAAIVTGLLKVLWEPLKIAVLNTFADDLDANAAIPGELAQAIRDSADSALAEVRS